jgi:hypothetical protein
MKCTCGLFHRRRQDKAGSGRSRTAAARYRVWSRTGHDLLYQSGDQIIAASYTAKGDTFVAEKTRVWIAKLGAGAGPARWDLAPDGKRVAVVTPVESVEAPKQEHEIVMLQNFFDELRRRVPASRRESLVTTEISGNSPTFRRLAV